ncbi:glycosyltransferase family 2 protein [Vibrio sp. CAU 1672]|uniref:glycosyltransferase family 2 protein n=1 Tax=Vibrio sp. CAU 1672 TaxID=3032594 RepID=UPI0023DCDED0|nr:glycosyltransferase family 2 protein [Vibrio sp. CAU 1672]MDF2155723.1 glycosyltransferase family 2 protein [Vibrio sp. CAU 1672]
MKIFISVVSHGHSELINDLSCVSELTKHFHVVVKSNNSTDDFSELTNEDNFHWINEQYGCGFGRNNNIVFDYCLKTLGMNEQDLFIVLNPDVYITANDINRLSAEMICCSSKVSAINLYKNKELTEFDDSIRTFPSLFNFACSFLGLGNRSILDKSKIASISEVDWAAGSFLAFRASHYKELQGFDENYFMYCEDIDICYRSNLLGCKVKYHPSITALHLAKHANRKLMSKHFVWHVSSVIRFLLTRLGITSTRSLIEVE